MTLAASERSRLRRESLSATWLAARLGTEPERVEVRRRSGELLGFREPGGQEFLYPVWQFDREGTPFGWVATIVEAAREAGCLGRAALRDPEHALRSRSADAESPTSCARATRSAALAAIRSATVRPA